METQILSGRNGETQTLRNAETQVLSRNGHVNLTLTAPSARPPAARPVTEAMQASTSSRARRWLFRAVRLACAAALAYAAVVLVQKHVRVISSDQAYLNGSVTALRAPIAGVLRLEAFEPGVAVAAGATLFRVENPRFGNVEAMSQLNWVQELVDRLRVESTEAELRLAHQEELFRHQEALFRDKIISRIVYFEEESKVALSRITLNSKKDQLRAARARSQEIEKQLALQKQAVASMPFDGVVWSARVQNGSEVSSHETVLQIVDPGRVWVDAFVNERHTDKFQLGTPVMVRAVDGPQAWTGRVESIRGGAGRIDPEQFVAAPAGDLSRRRVAVRIKLESANPFGASEFFGIGRSVKVTPIGHE
jgi:multidrug resistance efflux pump